MPPSVSIIVSIIFLLIGIVSLFTMLVVQGGRKVGNPKSYVAIHKVSGYVFAALFLVMFVGMTMRMKNYDEEWSARVAIHVTMAIGLLFLLAMKVLIPRFFNRLSGNLFALGMIVYALSFCVVLVMVG